LEYLKVLKPDPKPRTWFAGFDEEGVWKAGRVSAHLARTKGAPKKMAPKKMAPKKTAPKKTAAAQSKKRAATGDSGMKPKKPKIEKKKAANDQEEGFPNTANSCHFDSFLEACYACVHAAQPLPLWLTQVIENPMLELEDTWHAEALLSLGLRFRHHIKSYNGEQAIEFREALRNKIDITYGNQGKGQGGGGRMADPFCWVENCSRQSAEKPEMRLLGLHFREKKTCDCGTTTTDTYNNNFVLHHVQGNTMQEIFEWELVHHHGECGVYHRVPTATATHLDPPAIIPFNMVGSMDLNGTITLGEHRYGVLAAIRHPPVHFTSFVRRGHQWFQYDDQKVPPALHLAQIPNEDSMAGRRGLFFFGRVE